VHLCDLLDEILVIFAALFLREVLHASAGQAALALALMPAGSAVGLVVLDRLVDRVPPGRLLVAIALPCGIAVVAVALAPSVAAALVLLPLLGLLAAPLYPLAKARAYRALPEDSTAVNAVDSGFGPLGAALPLLVAGVADAAGLRIALLVLLLSPLSLLVLTAWERASAPGRSRSSRGRRPPS
jgi:MFS family permease